MNRDDDALKENHVFISQGNSKSTNDTGKNVQDLGSSVELMGLVNQTEEALIPFNLSDANF